MNLLKSFLILIFLISIPKFGYSQIEKNQSEKRKRLFQLILTDSIYEVTQLLNEDIYYAKEHNLPLKLAKTNKTLGHIFAQIESYDTAAKYYLAAFHTYDSLKRKKDIDTVLTQLSRNYVESKNYAKFDSLIPIALSLSKELNSVNYLYNLESKVRKNHLLENYGSNLELCNSTLPLIDQYAFDTPRMSNEKTRLNQFFTYYKAVALINLKQYDEGYDLIFKIDPQQFRVKGHEHASLITQISTLNYYKFKYYSERLKQLDSANKYLLIADSLKFLGIKSYQDRLSQNGNLIYKIIDTEKQLQLTMAKREQDRMLSKAFIVATIILSLLLIGVGLLFYNYYHNRKRVKNINQKLKESNRRLKIVDKERLEFFSILSHELRTPIYGINGLATLIEQEQSPEKRKGYLNALIASSNYISVLIDNVLQISKLKFEKKKLLLKPGNIFHIVNKISSSIMISANQKGLELFSNINKNNKDELLLIDNVVLSQILINLTYNAVKYTSHGYVSINVTEQKRTATHVNLLFEIKDSGIGIKNKHHDIIFNAFENNTFLEKNSSGSGLGLYIVKTLLTSYNSKIQFKSKPNEGSVFYFNIDFEIAARSTLRERATKPVGHAPTRILIVDDNAINLMITQKNVEKIPGYTSETVTRGNEAICLIKEKDFDLVLMDINMPDMDGYEATKHIRLFNPNIPVVALTALNSSEVQNKAKACGMNHVITKPYEFEEFKAVILKYSNVLEESII